MKIYIVLLLTMSCLTFSASAFTQKHVSSSKQKERATEIRDDSLSFLPQGTIIHKRTKDKIYCFLPHNTKIQGILCRGDKHRGWETVFYANGKLAKAWLARTEEIQGVPCKAASFWTELLGGGAAVDFHDNGKLARCKLAKGITIEGHAFKKGDHVRFDRQGKLVLQK